MYKLFRVRFQECPEIAAPPCMLSYLVLKRGIIFRIHAVSEILHGKEKAITKSSTNRNKFNSIAKPYFKKVRLGIRALSAEFNIFYGCLKNPFLNTTFPYREKTK
jgi:hypothetical protein